MLDITTYSPTATAAPATAPAASPRPDRDGPRMLLVTATTPLTPETLLAADALVVKGTAAARLLPLLRAHAHEAVALLPTYVLAGSSESESIRAGLTLADGVLAGPVADPAFVAAVRTRTVLLGPLRGPAGPAHVLLRLLRWLFTRPAELAPVAHPAARQGYAYPLLDALRADVAADEVLALALRHDYLRARFVERIHVCPGCRAGFLNFRETCRRCASAHLMRQPVLHHFQCAYVGPMADFATPNAAELTCPKCRHALRAPGVEYDEPSVIYACAGCGQASQQTQVRALCFTCHADHPVEALPALDVNAYALTERGEVAARAGSFTA